MAFPEILRNIETGSNTLASGAGPATALTGTKAHARATTPLRIGFYETSEPQLGDVLTDGSHVVWYNTASGRQFSKITDVRLINEATTGSITTGTPTLVVAAILGMSVDDTIKVAGAGAAGADLYSEISAIVSLTITLKDNAGTTVSGAAVTDPVQVTMEDTAWTIPTGDTTWAIGGKRGDLGSASAIFADAKGGWTMTFEQNSTNTAVYTSTASITLSSGGDTTNGRQIIRGTGSVRPILKTNGTTLDMFTVTAPLYKISNLSFGNTDDCFYLNNAAGTDILFDNCVFDDANGTITTSAIKINQTAKCVIINCSFIGIATGFIISKDAAFVFIDGCYFKLKTSGTTNGISCTAGAPHVSVSNCVFSGGGNASSIGCDLGSDVTAAVSYIQNNTFYNLGTGLSCSTLVRGQSMVVRNNIFHTCVVGAAFATGERCLNVYDRNVFFNCTTNESGATDASALEFDPVFLDPDNGDFIPRDIGGDAWSYDFNSHWGLPSNIGNSSTKSYIRQGASQMKTPFAQGVNYIVQSVIKPVSETDNAVVSGEVVSLVGGRAQFAIVFRPDEWLKTNAPVSDELRFKIAIKPYLTTVDDFLILPGHEVHV